MTTFLNLFSVQCRYTLIVQWILYMGTKTITFQIVEKIFEILSKICGKQKEI